MKFKMYLGIFATIVIALFLLNEQATALFLAIIGSRVLMKYDAGKWVDVEKEVFILRIITFAYLPVSLAIFFILQVPYMLASMQHAVIVVFAVYCIIELYNEDWQINLLKLFTIIILLLIIFVMISVMGAIYFVVCLGPISLLTLFAVISKWQIEDEKFSLINLLKKIKFLRNGSKVNILIIEFNTNDDEVLGVANFIISNKQEYLKLKQNLYVNSSYIEKFKADSSILLNERFDEFCELNINLGKPLRVMKIQPQKFEIFLNDIDIEYLVIENNTMEQMDMRIGRNEYTISRCSTEFFESL